jgi:hypothetical protein
VISVEPEASYPLFLQEDTGIVDRRVGGAAAAADIIRVSGVRVPPPASRNGCK